MTRATSPARPSSTWPPPASRTPRISGRRPSSTSSTRCDGRPTSANASFHRLDSCEGAWNTGREEDGGNLGYKTAYKGGYFPVAPTDHHTDLRDAMTFRLLDADLEDRARPSRGGYRGQAGSSTKSSDPAALGRRPDAVQIHRQERRRGTHGKTVTFMPKPLFGENGSGMHTHQWLWKTARRCSTTSPATADYQTLRGSTSAACCTTRRRCWRSPTRP